jgi:hypothetical protein
MARVCRHICDGLSLEFKDKLIHLFSDKPLSYDKGCYCRKCEMWIREPVSKEIKSTISTYDNNGNMIRYYVDTSDWKTTVWCLCCGTQCRGKTHASSKNRNKLQQKIFNTFPRKIEMERAPRGISNKSLLKQQVKKYQHIDEEGVFAKEGELELYNMGENENEFFEHCTLLFSLP